MQKNLFFIIIGMRLRLEVKIAFKVHKQYILNLDVFEFRLVLFRSPNRNGASFWWYLI